MNIQFAHTFRKPDRKPKSTLSDARISATRQSPGLSAGVEYAPETNTGTIILNITCVARDTADDALRCVKAVLASPYAFSNRYALAPGGASIGDFKVPARMKAIGTVCSLTLNGLLLNRGIKAKPKFGGVVVVKRGTPEKFSAFLSSGALLLVPLDDFLNGAMTSVYKTLQTGTGEVLGSFFEIPEADLGSAKCLYNQLKQIGMGGTIMFGMPSEPFLGMPVSIGSAGMVVFRDLNTVAALTEQGIKILSPTFKTLYPFEHLQISRP